MAWSPVDSKYQPRSGELMRYGIQIKAPFSDWLFGIISGAIQLGNNLKNLASLQSLHNHLEIRRIYYTLPMVEARTGRSEPWWIYIEGVQRVPEGGEVEEANAIYGWIALIVVASAAVLIAGKSFERFAGEIGGDVNETLKKVLNPGVVLAAFILGFLFLARR